MDGGSRRVPAWGFTRPSLRPGRGDRWARVDGIVCRGSHRDGLPGRNFTAPFRLSVTGVTGPRAERGGRNDAGEGEHLRGHVFVGSAPPPWPPLWSGSPQPPRRRPPRRPGQRLGRGGHRGRHARRLGTYEVTHDGTSQTATGAHRPPRPLSPDRRSPRQACSRRTPPPASRPRGTSAACAGVAGEGPRSSRSVDGQCLPRQGR